MSKKYPFGIPYLSSKQKKCFNEDGILKSIKEWVFTYSILTFLDGITELHTKNHVWYLNDNQLKKFMTWLKKQNSEFQYESKHNGYRLENWILVKQQGD